ncbi:MAG: AmmeMemoRadiSam system protein B [Bacteroidales bacterium]
MKSHYLSNLLIIIALLCSCSQAPVKDIASNTRQLVDTIGFAQYTWQMDSIVARLKRKGWKENTVDTSRFVICPHDDYMYVGALYPEVLQTIRAKTVILLGVAHKAASLGIEDSLVFDSFNYWKGPWGNVKVSESRQYLIDNLANRYASVIDTIQKVEHSLESMIPYLQYFNHDVEIIPILVPAMSPDRMKQCGMALADAIRSMAEQKKWTWGRDFAIVVTTDAVHYGNEDWGGSDRAVFGCDKAGNEKAMALEHEIIENCLAGNVTEQKIRRFSDYTINAENFREYKWTWCGRYCVPVAMYAAYSLEGNGTLNGVLEGYATSITGEHLDVTDLGMGKTAIATDCHWVGYAAIKYK